MARKLTKRLTITAHAFPFGPDRLIANCFVRLMAFTHPTWLTSSQNENCLHVRFSLGGLEAHCSSPLDGHSNAPHGSLAHNGVIFTCACVPMPHALSIQNRGKWGSQIFSNKMR